MAQLKACQNSMLKFDYFAQPFNFLLPEGRETYRSGKGCCMTLMLVIVVIFYGAMQSIKLFTFDETDVMVSQTQNYFDED